MILASSDITLYLDSDKVCRTKTNFAGSFNCPTLILNSGLATEFAFTASGSWGSDTGFVTLTAAEIPQAGSQAPTSLELDVEPTMVRLSGVVTDDHGVALEDARVHMGGVHSETLKTSADGFYTTRFIVNDPAAANDLTLLVQYGSAGFSVQKVLNLEVAERNLTEVVQDVTFAKRALELTGTLSNRHAPEIRLTNTNIEVWQGDTRICNTKTDANGNYTCEDFIVESTASLELRVETPDLWGSSAQTHVVPVDALPPVGERGSYTLNVFADATTIALSGTVVSSGDAVADAIVTVSGGIEAELRTGASGSYSGVFVLPTPRASLTLSAEASDGTSTLAEMQTVVPIAGQLNEVAIDLLFGQLEPGQTRWSRPGEVYAFALAPDGTLYAGAKGGVVALNADGTERWFYPLSLSQGAAHIAVAKDGTVYVGTGSYWSGGLYALDPAGNKLWHLAGRIGALALGHYGEIYAAIGGSVHALKEDGTELWQTNLRFVNELAVGANGTIYVGSDELYALSPMGDVVWSAYIGGDVTALALSKETIYVGGSDWSQRLYAVSTDGSRLWYEFFDEDINALALTGNDTLLVGADKLYELDVEGQERWSFSPVTSVQHLALGDDGVAYLAADKLYAVTVGGDEQWSASVDGAIGSLHLSADGTVLAGAANLTAINSTSSGLADSSWAHRGGDASNTRGLPHTKVLLQFTGTVTNQYTSEALDYYDVYVSDTSGDQLCSADTDEYGRYSCWAEVSQLEPFTAVHEIWDATLLTETMVSVRPEAPSSTPQTITTNLAVPLTTLRLGGKVTDVENRGLGGATLRILDSEYGDEIATVVADETGHYELLLVSDDLDPAEWSLEIQVSHEGRAATFYETVSATDGAALSEVALDLTIDPNAPGTSKWVFDSDYFALSSPALGLDGALYATGTGPNGPELLALTSDGIVKWTFAADPSLNLSYPVVGPANTVYFTGSEYNWRGDGRGVLYAVTPEGNLAWQVDAGRELRGLVVDDGGTLYLIDKRSTLYAVTAEGTVAWTYTIDEAGSVDNYGAPPLSISNDKTLYAQLDSGLYAVSSQGQPLWSVADAEVTAFDSDGNVLVGVGGYYGDLVALNSVDGSVLRTYTLSNASLNGISVDADGRIYAMAGYEGAGLDAFSADGELLWTYWLSGYSNYWTAVIGEDGTVYTGDSYTGIVALNADGAVQWRFTDGNYGNDPLLAPDGTLYAPTTDGKLYAFNTSSQGLAASPWPTFQGDAQNSGRAGQ